MAHVVATCPPLRDGDDAALIQLFDAMMAEFRAMGMQSAVASDGATLWLDGLRKGLGSILHLTVARANGPDGPIIGFLQAGIRIAPRYLGGGRVGHVDFLYVQPAYRGAGLARAMWTSTLGWFEERQAGSVVLEVLEGNPDGHAFWHRVGFADEMTLCRLNLPVR